jgi:hypothetical protein
MKGKKIAMAVLVTLAMSGAAHAQLASNDGSRPDSTAATTDSFVAAPINLDASDPNSLSASTAAPLGGPTTEDAGLPSAPQAKVVGYQRPTEKVKLINYLFDAYGPFPIVGAALIAAIDQADGAPHEWGGGVGGFGRRWGSNYGIGAITTTTRYGLAEILGEDTLYYRCQCTGLLPRFGHALISTVTGRRGDDGHRGFSVPSLVAPYVGEMVAVHAWYPGRYNSEDAFRQANYSLLTYAAGNVVLEFFPSGEHSILSKFHLQNRHSAPSNSN